VERFLWVSFAGALGTGTRYLVGQWAGSRFGTTLPYGTLIVNVAGCFLIALIFEIASATANFSPTLRLTLTTGFLGGLTTYSSFNYETTALFATGARGAALANFGITVFGCLAAGLLGHVLGRTLVES
jgi:CrcB protein